MEQSKQHKQILELGKKIVEELKLQKTVDTLSRWMAHYIAEKLAQIENEKDIDKKSGLQKEVSELILKIWDRRKISLDNLNPLHDLKQALNILELFQEKDNSLWGFSRSEIHNDALTEFASVINNSGYTILRISLLLSLLPDKIQNAKDWNEKYADIITADEIEIIRELELYLNESNFLEIIFTDTEELSTNKEDDSNIKELAINKIEKLMKEQSDAFVKLNKNNW